MIYEDVNEPIEVIVVFRNRKMQPLRFKWNERVYKISNVNGGWVSDEHGLGTRKSMSGRIRNV